MPDNKLYYGDNLHILREFVRSETVDLVYLDPPFNSNQSYNVLFEERNGSDSAAQIRAFEDTWTWDYGAEEAYKDVVESGPEKVSQTMQAFRQMLGENDMMAYLAMMAPRLVELRRVMKPTASIYLHCDPTASHYLKLLMDGVFGPASFRNEIIWSRSLPHGNQRSKFGASHDVIFFYTMGERATWTPQFQPHRAEYLEKFYRFRDPDSRRYRLISCINPNPNRPNLTYEWNGVTKVWKYTRERMKAMHEAGLLVYSRSGIPSYKGYLDQMKGTPMQDMWTDIPPLMGSARERLGYPTQKPEALLERVIAASSNEGDLVLDPFCGCGTAIAAAEKLGRRWMGIDVAYLAINLIKRRLQDSYPEAVYEEHGAPASIAGAMALAEQDRHEFELWALDLVGGRPADPKKGADRGIDGRIYFHDEADTKKTKQIILQVKSGKVGVQYVRDLRGVVERERADIGVLIELHDPTEPMRREAVSAGFYEHPFTRQRYPRIQILTIEQLLDGARIQYPGEGAIVDSTFRKAPKARRAKPNHEQAPLIGEDEE